MNYKVSRIGLLNFWYFDDEELNFFDGKMLLRGGNGSGKSVTMQSFIPLILDGNKTPNRLDPFGSKEKKIEDYLIGPSDGVQKEESIGYLYMEAYNEQIDKYITVGIGLRARKGRGTDFWGFALKDGRRLGKDFFLYKDYGQKVLLTKNELKARLGKDNEFTETAKEYKAIVNKLLFGFKEIDAYDEFINVLLQLRSSKLSKEYTPIKLMNILSSVLQPLTEDDLRPISEVIEDTTKTRETVEKLTSQVKNLSNFLKTYQNYNEILLYDKAKSVKEEEIIIKNKKEDITFKENEIDKIFKRLEEIKEKFALLEKEYNDNSVRLKTIDNKELKNYTDELEKIKQYINSVQTDINNIKEKIEKAIDEEREHQNKLQNIENDIYRCEKELSSSCDSVLSLNEDIKLSDVDVAINNIQKDKGIDFEYLNERVSKYKNKLNEIKIKLEEKENLDKELNNRQEEHFKLRKDYDEKEKELKKEESNLIQNIDNFKDEINRINKENKIIILEDYHRQKIFDLINNYSHQNYIKSKEIYQGVVSFYKEKEVEEKTNIVNKIKLEKENLNILNEELENLKINNELEFVARDEEETISKLLELNIPYIELYKTIEFKDNISEEDKNRIEENLITMNILNAKIVPSSRLKDIKNIKGVFLKKGTYKNNNILKYVNIVDNGIIDKGYIKEILSTISVDENESNYITPNRFCLDFIIGFSSLKYESKYIGILKRIENQKKKISDKEKEIELKESIINNYKNILDKIKLNIELIDEEKNNYPSDKDLEISIKNINIIETSLEIITNNIKEISDKIVELTKKIELTIHEINNMRDNIQIPLNLASYRKVISSLDALISNIYELKSRYESLNYKKDIKLNLTIKLDEDREKIEYQNEEFSKKKVDLNTLLSRQKAIDDILSNKEYQDILEEVKILTKRQNEIPNERELLSKEEGKLENIFSSLNKDVNSNKESLSKNIILLELKRSILSKEYNLKYVYKDEELNVDKILNDLKDRKNSDKDRALNNYYASFNEYRTEFLEYRVNTKEIFVINDNVVSNYIDRGLSEDDALSILNSGVRQDLTAIYQGKVMNIFELLSCLKDGIEESNNYITAQESHLFKDILLKTVGNKIRDRIQLSKEWVNQINNIMKNTQIDSNLSFQLEWKTKEAYTEDELDTKELERLFKIDPSIISDKDTDKLRVHFESQIKKELEYSEKTHESYSSIIGKVLDYRNWYEFKLYYRRKSGEKRELNNKAFFVFSGGERAKSMYVPLFAAVYAKLSMADDKALRLVALDEAFAGVDSPNIREMFDILAQLNLDYIMTSQILWGDYDTVKELSICELIKDEPNHAVAVRNYRWNGHSKEILE